jgi:hypothetical protein
MLKSRTTILLTCVFISLLISACAANNQHRQVNIPLQSLDRETADLADIRADVGQLIERAGAERVLVVFDLDNTLLAMQQGLGSDQWYYWQKDIDKHDHCSPDNVGNRFAVQGALFHVSAMDATQADAAEQLRAIQALGAPVIALTSRGMEYQLATFRELRRNGFSFAYSAIGPAGGVPEPFIPVTDGRLSLYQDGVFLTAGQHKGEMLKALLEKTNTGLPGVVVMVDDKQENLDAVKETFLPLEVAVHAWRYTGEDENVKNFDGGKAAAEWRALEAPLRQIQQVIGPDNYDLSTAGKPSGCQ